MEISNVFNYDYKDSNINEKITFPIKGSINEYAHIILNKYNIPRYLSKDLTENLNKFIKVYDVNSQLNYTESLISKAKSNQNDLEDITKEWEKLMREEIYEYGEKKCVTDEELFAIAYHKMVHSPALLLLLQLEHTYAKRVKKLFYERKQQILDLSQKQTNEMNDAVERLETDDMTECKINQLASKHFEEQSFLQVQLTSELDSIKEFHRREYREWLMQMVFDENTNNIPPVPETQSTSTDEAQNDSSPPTLEESFTIHLGSQLKQMHNIRILSGSVMEMCAMRNNESAEPTPQVLQTALNLYSNDLHGLVLLTDNIIGSRQAKDFREICQSSTDFHFLCIDNQFDKLKTIISEYKEANENNSMKRSNQLQAGDFYVTRHSNLSQAHVIFHIVADDSLRGNEINSRHPVVLGLRNILKTACSNDVTSLTIPLLLNYEISEEMTMTWCEKRAELVFKCVKGFMIEMASWGGSELKNLQFLLPQEISSAVFHSLTEMLPRIFKVSNPLILK